MENHKKISVVMSVYNAEKYLPAAVDSILNQTYPHFEFIIIEDGSSDRSLQILENYALQDSRVILIKNTVNTGNAGFIKNLNLGLQKSTGDFIARMDADDISHPSRFERQLQFLEQNPDIFMVGSSIQCIDKDDNPTAVMKALITDQRIKRKMPKQIALYHPVIMFRKFPEVTYREKMLYCEDYDLYFRLIAEGFKFANLESTLLNYRILNNSISRKSSSLIRWLFVEKARAFFRETQKTGKDSYDDFEPQAFLNILNPDYANERSDLLFALKTAVKYQNHEVLPLLFSKADKLFSRDNAFSAYRLLLRSPPSVSSTLIKILP